MALAEALICFLLLIYLFKKWQNNYWSRKGVANPGGSIRITEYPLSEVYGNFYDEFKSKGQKFFGIFTTEPVFVPIDLDLVKHIMRMDHFHFESHGMYVNEESDPLTGNLFNLEGGKWRNLRARLTPTFTSGRMKNMFSTLVECTTNLVDVLNEQVDAKNPIDIKEYLARFNTDIIGSVAFGVECNCLKNKSSDIREFSLKIFEKAPLKLRMIQLLQSHIPHWLFVKSRLKTTAKDVEDFFFNLVTATVDYREQNNVFRKDFLHLLIQLKNIGKVTDGEEITSKNGQSSLTINELVAQCYVFFIAGFETSSTTLSFTLFELSQDLDIQQKLRQEINEVLCKYDGKMTYDAIMEMEYLEMVMCETLRKHPALVMIPRKCTRPYRVPNSKMVLDTGTQIAIPIYSIHRDPEYWPDPDNFDPERFSPQISEDRHPFSFFPFGEGPRFCIGSRFAKLQFKVGLISILTNFEVTLNEKTQLPIKYAPSNLLASVVGGLWINLRKIKTTKDHKIKL